MRTRLVALVAGVLLAGTASVAAVWYATPSGSLQGETAATSTPVAATPATSSASIVAFHRVDTAKAPSAACVADLSCLRQYYQNLTWQEGPDEALKLLTEHGVQNPVLEQQCHDTTHAIGEVAGKVELLPDAMERGDERCGSGYYHGVIATFLTKLDPADVVPALVDACATGTNSFRRWECYHGVGHSFVFNAAGDIVRAVESCGTIVASSDRGACASGAFMQELVDNGEDAERYGADPYAACRKVTDEEMRSQCYDMHAVIIVQQRETPVEQFAVCETVEDQHKTDCWGGLGRALFSGMPHETQLTEQYCSAAATQAAFDWCLDGVVSNTAAYFGSGDEAAPYCEGFRPENQVKCLEVLERRWGLSEGVVDRQLPSSNTNAVP